MKAPCLQAQTLQSRVGFADESNGGKDGMNESKRIIYRRFEVVLTKAYLCADIIETKRVTVEVHSGVGVRSNGRRERVTG